MTFDKALKRKLLSTPIGNQVTGFLAKALPRFKAPTDPIDWLRKADVLRRQALDEVFLKGYPKSVVESKPKVVWGEVLKPRAPYVIRKLCYEAYPNYWIPALLYEPKKLSGKVPVVINPNGHHRGGKAADYKQVRCANLARRGMIALNFEFIGMSELEADAFHNDQAHLSLVGMRGVGLFYLAMRKGLDVLLDHKHADRRRVAMTGLSGGGWQTIVLSALDPRITVSVPVAGYTAVRARVTCPRDIGDLEQVPPDMTTLLDYDTMTAMLAPRPTLIIMNAKDDCCFRTETAKPVIFDAVRPTYRAFNAEDRFECYSNTDPGTHNYGADNRAQLYRFLDKHFKLRTPAGDVHDESELYTERELFAGISPSQPRMVDLAHRRAVELQAGYQTPKTDAARRKLRRAIANVIRLPKHPLRARVARSTSGLWEAEVKTGRWSAAVTARVVPGSKSACVLLRDQGRAGSDWRVPTDQTVAYVDLLGIGEAKPPANQAMLIETAGHRLLGIQVAQLLACAQAVARRFKVPRVSLRGYDVVSSTVCLIAAALHPERFTDLTRFGGLRTLRLLMSHGRHYEEAQSLFCADLLSVADIPQMESLATGVTLYQPMRNIPPERAG